MRAALDDLRCRYDFVLLDAPPVLPVTDAVILGREAEGVVLVVKGHDTPRELVRRARDHLQQAGARMLGVVVNNVDLSWGDVYFYRQYFNGYYGQPIEEPA
jgi:Mrp family chromosome partitioning ATPase